MYGEEVFPTFENRKERVMKTKKFIINVLVITFCAGVIPLFIVICDKNRKESSPTNNANMTEAEKMKTGMPVDEKMKNEFVKNFRESEILKEEVGELKEELEEYKNQLSGGIKLIKENKDKEDETNVTLPDGDFYSLFQVRRDMNVYIQEIEILQPKIAEKEAEIAELQKKNDAILTDKKKKEKEFWATPSDDELLKKGRELLGPDAPPAAAPPPAPTK